MVPSTEGDLVPNGWCQAHKETWNLMDGAKHKKTWNLMDGADHRTGRLGTKWMVPSTQEDLVPNGWCQAQEDLEPNGWCQAQNRRLGT